MRINDYKDLSEADRWSVRLGQAFAVIKANGYRLAQDDTEQGHSDTVVGRRVSRGGYFATITERSQKTGRIVTVTAAQKNRPVKTR